MAKKKPGKVNRVVYIDSALDARMKKASDVNWSAVASMAFASVLESRGIKVPSFRVELPVWFTVASNVSQEE